MLPRGRRRSGGACIGRSHLVAHAALVLVFMRVMRDRNSDASILHVVSICSMRFTNSVWAHESPHTPAFACLCDMRFKMMFLLEMRHPEATTLLPSLTSRVARAHIEA